MSQDFVITVDDDGVKALNYALEQVRASNRGNESGVPKDVDEFVRTAFQAQIVNPYLSQLKDNSVNDAKQIIDTADAETLDNMKTLFKRASREDIKQIFSKAVEDLPPEPEPEPIPEPEPEEPPIDPEPIEPEPTPEPEPEPPVEDPEPTPEPPAEEEEAKI